MAASGRERVLETAYELFSRHGTKGVGVDRIIAESGVAKMTLYRNFASKDELILAFLERREERWTRAWLQAEVERREADPAARLLAIFDVFGEWFATEGFEGCSFVNVMLEVPVAGHPVREACVRRPGRDPHLRRGARGAGGARGPRRARAPVAHPHEGQHRLRRRGRRRGGRAGRRWRASARRARRHGAPGDLQRRAEPLEQGAQGADVAPRPARPRGGGRGGDQSRATAKTARPRSVARTSLARPSAGSGTRST